MTVFEKAWDAMQPELIVKARITPEGVVFTHAGMGGGEEGAKRAGLPTFYSADMWEPAMRVNAANHPEAVHDLVEFDAPGGRGKRGSVPEVGRRILDAVDGRSFHLHGSPPCQDVSRATRKPDYQRALNRPGGIVWWYNLLNHLQGSDNPPVSWSMEETQDAPLAIMGSPRLNARFKSLASTMPKLTASQFGMPQVRTRTFMGEHGGKPWEAQPTHGRDNFVSMAEAMPWLVDEWEDNAAHREKVIGRQVAQGRLGSEAVEFLNQPTIGSIGAINPGLRSASWNEGVPQNKASYAFQHLTPLDRPAQAVRHHRPTLTHTRALTPQEVLQMHGFRPDYDLSGAGRRQDLDTMLGNVVSPAVMEGVLRGIMRGSA